MRIHIAVLAFGLLASPLLACAAEPAVRLDVDDLIQLADPGRGECYTVALPQGRITNAPPRLFVYRAAQVGDVVTFRVPVPADGYYSVRSQLVHGPWGVGRHGRFEMVAGSIRFPGRCQGWYGVKPKEPYRMRDEHWGVAHLSAPAVDLSLQLTHAGHGRLLLLADLRLEPCDSSKLEPEDLQRRAPAATLDQQVRTGESRSKWPLCDVQRTRGLEWTTMVTRRRTEVRVDGLLDEWPAPAEWPIRLDDSIPPGHGWATPKPEGPADLSARVVVSWDETFLYVAAKVRDDDLAAKTDEDRWGSPWEHDGLVVQINAPGWLTGGRRSVGPVPESVTFGLNYASADAAPRELAAGSRYAVRNTEDGYVVEAAIAFEAMGWRPARIGDRFPFTLILVDRDPHKPAGRQFDQYGWNFGAGSTAGMGEIRLLADGNAAGELIPEHRTIHAGQPIRYVGTVDARCPAVIKAIELVRQSDAKTMARYDVGRQLPESGRYRLMGELPATRLEPGRHELRLVW